MVAAAVTAGTTGSGVELRGVRIGAAAMLEVETAEGPREYRTRVEDVEGNLVHVGMPTERGAVVVIPLREEVTIHVAGASAATLSVRGEVAARRTTPFPALVIRATGIEANQQRSFHRVRLQIQPEGAWIWTGPVSPPAQGGVRPGETDPNWQRIPATICDLSGGGLGLRAEGPLENGTPVWLRFALPVIEESLSARGQVVSCRALDSVVRTGAAGAHHVGVRFEDLSRVDQERLVRALTRVQLEERRKARGG
ncbi:MAG TPA: PilZ domain-containing protein [Chloroflexota bacterium]|nr:PilZ domain-containing protein [Chloroflexota bacterium]